MRTPIIFTGAICLLAGVAVHARDLGRETLQPENGWAASGSGVIGGSAAVDAQIYTVTNRAELIAALNNGVTSSTSPSNPSNEPKIIYVQGTIETLNVDFSATLMLTLAFAVTLEALNLTDEFQDQYVGSVADRLSYYHHQGRQYLLGARYKF